MKKDHEKYYSELLYSLLPEIYRTKDRDKKELENFLKIIGEQTAVLRQNMDELWYDFFIETCHDWVVPYIGDLGGTNLVFNEAAHNRVDVKKTIFWRRRKGTLYGLEDLAQGITGWGVKAIEFFEMLNWSQNMNHVRLDKSCTPDLKNVYQLEKLNTALDTLPHTVDIRSPSQQHGRYNIKNFGCFLFTKQVYRIDQATPEMVSSGKYTFSPIGKDAPLFNSKTEDMIKPIDFQKDPYNYFDDEIAILCDGVLIASPKPPKPAPVQSKVECTIGELNEEIGMRMMDWADQREEFRIEAINFTGAIDDEYKVWGTLLTLPNQKCLFSWGELENKLITGEEKYILVRFLKAKLELEWLDPITVIIKKIDNGVTIFVKGPFVWPPFPQNSISIKLNAAKTKANLTIFTDKRTYEFLVELEKGELKVYDKDYWKDWTGTANGTFMVRISLDQGRGALFPQSILALRGKDEITVNVKYAKESVYSNALYVYLPEVFLNKGDELYLFVDDLGATYFAHDGSIGTGEPNIPPSDAFSSKPARESEGQVYPSRSLSNSMKPLKFDSINIEAGLVLHDKKRFTNKRFTVACCGVKFDPAPSEPLTLGILDIDGTVAKYAHKSALAGGGLALRINPIGNIAQRFPQCEIVLKDSRGRGTLIYLPEVYFNSDAEEIYLYPADDGSTYYTNHFAEHKGKPILKPDRSGAFSITFLARKSAGQVLPIPDTYPLQQRKIEYRDLCGWEDKKFKEPPFGTVTIDPIRGRFCFPKGDTLENITVKYNHAFTHDVGAWPIDRRFVSVMPEPTIKVRRSDKSSDGFFSSLSEAIEKSSEKGVIQIEDSLTYDEIYLRINKSLTIQAANFQRPTVLVNNIDVEEGAGEIKLDGIFFTSGIKLKESIAKLVISSCTFNPEKTGLEVPESVSIGSIEISNSIIGKIACKNADNIKITDSIVHNESGAAIYGSWIDEHSNAVLTVEQSTILGDCRVKELYSSDSIHLGIIDVINTQDGCIRYCRYQKEGSRLPAVFYSTEDIPLFNSRLFWRYDYCELAANCSENVKTKSEKGSEIGAFSGAQNPIREKNLRIKLQEYMPTGLRPVVIYEL